MELTHDDLVDAVKRLMILVADQRAATEALTLAMAGMVVELVPDTKRAGELILQLARFMSVQQSEILEGLLIGVEDQHPELAANLSDLAAEMKAFRDAASQMTPGD